MEAYGRTACVYRGIRGARASRAKVAASALSTFARMRSTTIIRHDFTFMETRNAFIIRCIAGTGGLVHYRQLDGILARACAIVRHGLRALEAMALRVHI